MCAATHQNIPQPRLWRLGVSRGNRCPGLVSLQPSPSCGCRWWWPPAERGGTHGSLDAGFVEHVAAFQRHPFDDARPAGSTQQQHGDPADLPRWQSQSRGHESPPHDLAGRLPVTQCGVGHGLNHGACRPLLPARVDEPRDDLFQSWAELDPGFYGLRRRLPAILDQDAEADRRLARPALTVVGLLFPAGPFHPLAVAGATDVGAGDHLPQDCTAHRHPYQPPRRGSSPD